MDRKCRGWLEWLQRPAAHGGDALLPIVSNILELPIVLVHVIGKRVVSIDSHHTDVTYTRGRSNTSEGTVSFHSRGKLTAKHALSKIPVLLFSKSTSKETFGHYFAAVSRTDADITSFYQAPRARTFFKELGEKTILLIKCHSNIPKCLKV